VQGDERGKGGAVVSEDILTCDVRRVTCDVLRAMCDVRRVTCDVRRATCDVTVLGSIVVKTHPAFRGFPGSLRSFGRA
jgi:hypothetical protein